MDLWVLVNENGSIVRAMDCAGDPILVYKSRDDAEAGVDKHGDLWFLECHCEPLTKELLETDARVVAADE